MTTHYINSARDLADWVSDHADPSLSQTDLNAICKAIWDDDDCPNWGNDWSEFLASLPDSLLDLIEEN